MRDLFIYFTGILAYNITASLVAFAVAFASRRKRYPIGWLRGAAVLILGWILGSGVVFVVHILSSLGGIEIEDTVPWETVIALGVLFPVMFLLLDISKPKTATTAPHETEQPNL